MRVKLGIAVFGLLALVASAALAAGSPPAMIAPGQFNVSATGAGTYTLPVAVPPGTAGMVPSLSLDYSSQSGDGIEGIGWTLSGLPSITRCPRTLAQDGVHGSVNYDTNDRFCMDGQRLILASGTYGADGSQYRTEVEGFSKIVEHNAINASNCWFEVWTKSGQHMEFGNTTDSQVLTVGLTTNVVRAWAVDRISDTVGNYLTATYNCAASGGSCTDTDRTTYGEAYPLRVDYTGHNSSPTLSPYNSVQFTYTTRSDTRPMYQAGAVQQTTVVLTHIKTYQGTSMVYDYQFGYRAGTSILSSRLTSVTLCGASTCLAPTTFTWQGGTGLPALTGTGNSLAQGTSLVPGDFNGDGLTDVMVAQGSNCGIWAGSNAGTYSRMPIYANYTEWYYDEGMWYNDYLYDTTPCFTTGYNKGVRSTNDFDGDGFSDIPLNQPHNSSPSGYFTHPLFNDRSGNLTENGAAIYQSLPPIIADFNGDGRADMLGVTPLYGNYYQFALSQGNAPFDVRSSPLISGSTAIAVGDFDGDGCADTLQFSSSNTVVFSSFCNSAVSSFTLPTLSAGAKITLGDFNGDGKTDVLVTYPSAAGTLYLSTGTGLVATSFAVPSDWGKYTIVVGDWNGDGKQDIGLMAAGGSGMYTHGTDHQIWLSTGSGFVSQTTISNSNSADTSETPIVADWNNDGAGDIWLQKPSGDTVYTFAYAPELITGISNGLTGSGSPANTTVTYDRLNGTGSIYTKGASASYPTQDIDGPLYVVSRVDAGNGLGTCNPASSYTNCYSSTYAYAGAKVNLTGRGFLGFASVAITDLQTGIVQTTNYNTSCNVPSGLSAPYLECPKLGLIDSQTKVCPTTVSACSSGAVTLNSTANTYTATNLGGTSNFVSLTESVVTSHDLNAAAMPATTTDYTYDSYGNALTVNVAVAYSGSTSYKYTTNTYNNDTTNWFLGRLLTTAVNSIVGSSNLTRHSSFCYDAGTGLLTREVIEPGSMTCTSGSPGTNTLITDYTYDVFGHRTATAVSGGSGSTAITSRTSYAGYDSVGQFQTSATNALGQSESWAYDTRFAGPTSHTGPNGLTTTWAYDDIGRQTNETRPDGTQTISSFAYCSGVNGGTATCVTYGAYLAKSDVYASDGTTHIAPSSTGYFDVLSRAVAGDTQGFDGSTIRVTTNYDANGRVYQTSRPYFATAPPCSSAPCWTTNTYDTLGRVTAAAFPDSSTASFGFNGLTTTATNSLSQTTTTVMNPQGLKASVTNPNSQTTNYVYDAFGNPLTVTDPASNVVTNAYDITGRKTDSYDPDMGHWTYTYDALGELLTQTDAKSQTATLTYDLLGRKLTRTESGLYSSWTYGTSAASHNIGQLVDEETCTASGCGSVVSDRAFTYDSLARPYQTTLTKTGSAFTYTSAYNATNGKIDTVSYPSGLAQKYLYATGTGYLCRITDNGAGHTCTDTADSHVLYTINARDAELHLTQGTMGNGVVVNQTFNPQTGLITCTYTGAGCTSGSTVASFGYNFDTIGNLTNRTDSNEGFTERFCYDSLNRLTSYQITSSTSCPLSGGTTVSYDGYSMGNIAVKSDVGTYSYPAAGGGTGTLPHAVTSISGTADGLTNPIYTYDANGNMTCVSTGAGCTGTVSRSLTVTAFNMPDVIAQGTTTIGFTYDGDHQRIAQTASVSGVVTTTVYVNDPASGAMSQQVTSGTTASWTDYLMIDGKIVGQRTNTPAANQRWGGANWCAAAGPGCLNWTAASSTSSWNWFVLDHLGSVAVVTDASGSVMQRLSYDAWGMQRNPNGTAAACGSITSPTTRGFTNQEQVPQGCLVNLNARLYNAQLGRFMSPDPVVGEDGMPGAFNRYTYVLDNPLSFTDPSGLCFLGCFWKSPIFIGVIGVAIAIFVPVAIYGSFGVFTAGSAGAIADVAIGGALSGATTAGLSGGNVLHGALFGGLSGAAFAGLAPVLGGSINSVIGSAFGPGVPNFVGQAIASGFIGGTLSVAQGGNFPSGFLAAGVGSLAGGFSQGNFDPGKLIASAVLGGAASVLGGGKFANGAITGAFAYASTAHYADSPDSKSNGYPSNQYAQADTGIATDALQNDIKTTQQILGSSPFNMKQSDFDALYSDAERQVLAQSTFKSVAEFYISKYLDVFSIFGAPLASRTYDTMNNVAETTEPSISQQINERYQLMLSHTLNNMAAAQMRNQSAFGNVWSPGTTP